MADIELVIKIPEEAKQAFDCAESNDLKGCYYDHGGVIGNAIKEGTLLPKGYGRLIDVDEVVKDICVEYKVNSIYELPNELKSFIKKYLNKAPTILKPTIEYMIKNYAFSESEDKE